MDDGGREDRKNKRTIVRFIKSYLLKIRESGKAAAAHNAAAHGDYKTEFAAQLVRRHLPHKEAEAVLNTGVSGVRGTTPLVNERSHLFRTSPRETKS